MSQRYRMTRAFRETGASGMEQTISLEECKRYFATQPDFVYTTVYTVKGSGTATMSIEGDFFLWTQEEPPIPFRHYQGDLYVSGTNPAVIPKLMEVADKLKADVQEG